jgi:membrane protein required for colicin V production
MAHQSIDMVDKSRAAKVYASFKGGVEGAMPDNLLNQIVERYNGLTAICAPAGAATAPATGTTAPTTGN